MCLVFKTHFENNFSRNCINVMFKLAPALVLNFWSTMPKRGVYPKVLNYYHNYSNESCREIVRKHNMDKPLKALF